MRIETVGGKRYLVVKDTTYYKMDSESMKCLENEDGIEVISEQWFEKTLTLLKEKISVIDVIIFISTQTCFHDLSDDKGRTIILGQLKLLKSMILNLYHLDKHELQVCYDEVDERLGDILKELGYDSIEDL